MQNSLLLTVQVNYCFVLVVSANVNSLPLRSHGRVGVLVKFKVYVYGNLQE